MEHSAVYAAIHYILLLPVFQCLFLPPQGVRETAISTSDLSDKPISYAYL